MRVLEYFFRQAFACLLILGTSQPRHNIVVLPIVARKHLANVA